MPKVYNISQGTLEWLRLRAGKPTASELHNLVTPLFKPRDSKGRHSYLMRKLAEKWIGDVLPDPGSSWAMEQGNLREEDAIPSFEFDHGVRVEQVGFIETDDGTFGCSPDGLIGDAGGLEIKCCQPAAHLEYCLAGELPKEYAAQVHGCMFATGRRWWIFKSYRPGYPEFEITVQRDEAIMAKIKEVVDAFATDLDAALAKLKTL